MIDGFTICLGLAALVSLGNVIYAGWRGYEPDSAWRELAGVPLSGFDITTPLSEEWKRGWITVDEVDRSFVILASTGRVLK
jgi:hypothetical protein